MNQIPWSIIALGLAVGSVLVAAATLLVEHLARRYPFYARVGVAIFSLLGWAAITVAANPNVFEDPVLSGIRIGLVAVLGVQIGKLVVEKRRRNVA